MNENLLKLENVTKSYGPEARVLHGIDLSLERGEFAAIVGPSGSGKSTLLNLIGLLDRPSTGEITINGSAVSRLDEAGLTRLRSRSLGFIFQFHHLLPALSAIENVMLPLTIQRGATDSADRAAAQNLLEQVGLAERALARPTQLSGGQQQRVAIARALIGEPPLILADEPTGNLDTRTSDETFELMRRFNQERGSAFLIVTHDPRLAARCDRVIEIIDGRIHSDA